MSPIKIGQGHIDMFLLSIMYFHQIRPELKVLTEVLLYCHKLFEKIKLYSAVSIVGRMEMALIIVVGKVSFVANDCASP